MTRKEAELERVKKQERMREKYRTRYFDPSEYHCWLTGGGIGTDISMNLEKYERCVR